MSTTTVVEAWTEAPLVRYVGQASARLVVVMTPSGQVLAQHGFARAMDLMSAAALGAAIMASAGALAQQIGERRSARCSMRGCGTASIWRRAPRRAAR